MHGVWYAAIAVVFVVGMSFVAVYARRAGRGHSGPAAGQHVGHTHRRAAGETITPGVEGETSPATGPVPSPTASPVADAAATEAARARAQAEADAVRDAARAGADTALRHAREQADAIVADARTRAQDEIDSLTAELTRQHAALGVRTTRLDELESRLEQQEARLDQRAADQQQRSEQLTVERAQLHDRARRVDAERADLDAVRSELEAGRTALAAAVGAQERELERVGGLTAEQARTELLAGVEVAARRDAAVLARAIEDEARADGTAKARAIVSEAVQRVASAQTAETVVSVLHLPGEEMKGRIIGREGRNIRAFESVTGVNVLIDDTPEAVLLSCFDPVRREIGRVTLDKLVTDGRIHPHRIEEAYAQSVVEVEALCERAARDAVAEVGIGPVDERLIPYLGRLRYRTSYGQNVLGHLVETAHVAGVMAAELGIEPTLVKRCAFLHDIGKALTHEVEGSHAIVGADLLRRFGESEAVAHAVEAHHNEVQPRTVEAVLTQASDSCSASRPGARRESVEAYVKRLARIEEIAATRPGVDKVFAMQSGREVRVMVAPADVDDLAASVLAREIAKQIEDELTYPGQIRVTVVRESRATEIAH